MANFNGNLNLLGFVGAQLLSGIDQKNPQRGYVCVPIDMNEVKVAQDGKRATVRVNMWQTSDALFNAAVRNAQAKGEQVPTRETFMSHQLELSFSDDYVKNAIKLYGKALIDKVLAANPNHPEYAQQVAEDPTTPVFKAIRGFMQKRLANMYVNRPKEQAQQPVVMQTVQGVTGYQAPAQDDEPFGHINYDPEMDDMPF